jgi:3-oxoacyl-[acyl-carrier protein] reductase
MKKDINHKFLNSTALVVGGTRGIGKAVAIDLLNKGSNVVITGSYIRNGWWDDFENCEFKKLDFIDFENRDKYFSSLVKKNYKFIVNSAGIVLNKKFDKIKETEIKELMEVNFFGPMLLLKNLIIKMGENNFGRIVNISSVAALIHRVGSSVYSISKSSLITASRTLALELANKNILVNCVSPGYTDTEMIKTLSETEKLNLIKNVPISRLCTPKEVSNVVLFLLSPHNNFITGQNIIIDGGLTLKQK